MNKGLTLELVLIHDTFRAALFASCGCALCFCRFFYLLL